MVCSQDVGVAVLRSGEINKRGDNVNPSSNLCISVHDNSMRRGEVVNGGLHCPPNLCGDGPHPALSPPLLPPPNLCAQVRASRGLQRTNKDLSDGMAHSLLCRLRWSGRPEDQATLAVILLKVGEKTSDPADTNVLLVSPPIPSETN